MKKYYVKPISNSIGLAIESELLSGSIEIEYSNEYSDREQLSNQASGGWSSDSWSNSEDE